jgi:hypothetical protein
MSKPIDTADGTAIIGVGLGLLSLFVPWYSYSAIGEHVTVNGFRASFLGVVFLLALAAMALLQLIRHGAIDERAPARSQEQIWFIAVAGVAGAVVLLQSIVDLIAGGRAPGFGLLLAFLSAVALGVSAWLRTQEYTPGFVRAQRLVEDLPD